MTAHVEKREIGNLLLENIPDIPETISERLNQYHSTREAFLVDWLGEDSGLLISTRFGESAQLHLLENAGGARRQLTFFAEPVFSAAMRPRRNGFLFSKDHGGNENYQFYYYNLDSGHYQLLTDGTSKHGNPVWSPDGAAFIYNSTKRNQEDHDLYLYHLAGEGEQLILEGEGFWYPVDWSPNGQLVTVIHYLSINESHLYVLDITTGALKAVVAKAEVACRGGFWGSDGKELFFSSDEFSECRQLLRYEQANGRVSPMATGLTAEVEGMRLSPDGLTLAFLLNDNGISRLYLLNIHTHACELVDCMPEGIIDGLRWDPTSSRLAFTLNASDAPADVFVLRIADCHLTRWTSSEVGGLDRDDFVRPKLIHYPTFDAVDGQPRQIPAFYYRPNKGEGPFPVLIYIHGGPESQFRPGFSPTFQYYLNEMGVAVLAPNVRGSTGYGKHFLKLDNGYLREDSVKDIGKLLDWAEQQPELDSRRVAAIGGSYGGYMVLASMALFNGRLCCGVDIVGISNFVTFLENTKSYRRNLRRVEYGDERDPRMRRHLQRISPTTNAHKISKPMLIVQGQNDPRVPASEAEQMLHAIRRNGGEAWYLLARDEGHGFRKRSNREFYDKAVVLFLQRYLLG
ncbi:MAG: S9 family peptidase [Phaeodactylibacter sp.]|nr:S9 family peptidase [Phaeodactylibacter sp.]MCB9276992.1 S9 family peptidase [Lewinellaceae bacterium]